ncbi:MAG: ATP-dependent helicase, partial [Actinobacteria bacterium]|nr:ATP-dependent helicase [Actinomycetota bacterium]
MNQKIKKITRTKQQKSIISSTDKIKRIIACPGSGKTYVLAHSIAEIINNGFCQPQEILAITFTKNAAENMVRRVRELLNKDIDYNAINIFTFNSFGNMIISENNFEMGLGSDYRLINISKAWQILYSVLKQAELKSIKVKKDTGKFLNDVLLYIQDLKNNLISVKDLKTYTGKRLDIFENFASRALINQELEIMQYQEDLAMLYEEYENNKNSSNLIDYNDHIFKPYQLFLSNSDICSKYKKRYKYIFIDEFQDTDAAQAYLIAMIYDPGSCNITVVGDDDQGIYSFRGACIENILNFHKWDCFSELKVKDFLLTTNFRSGSNIVNALQSVISGNKKRFPKSFGTGDSGKNSAVFFSYYNTKFDEALSIADNINHLLSSGFKLKDIAVISRRKNFKNITAALDKKGIRYELISRRGFFFEPEILFIISWLILLYDIFNEQHLIYLLQSEKYKISDRDIFFLKNKNIASGPDIFPDTGPIKCSSTEKHLIDEVLDYKNNSFLSKSCCLRLKEFAEEFNFYMSQ